MFKKKKSIPVALVVFLLIGSALNAVTTEYFMDFVVYDGVTSFDEDDVDTGIDEGNYVFCHDSDGAGSNDVFVDFVLVKDNYSENYSCFACGDHKVNTEGELFFIMIDLNNDYYSDVCVVTEIKISGQEWSARSDTVESVVISKAAESGRTLAHEVGHNAGLVHTTGIDRLMYKNESGSEDEIRTSGSPNGDEKDAFEDLISP